MLATLQEAKAILKISYGDQDAGISMALGAATNVVLDYLKSTGEEFQDSAGETVPGLVPDDVKYATIMYAGYLIDQQNNLKLDEPGGLPQTVQSLLQALRLPTLA